MPKKTDIDKDIINYLKTVDWPSTTESVAKAIGRTWHTTQVHLFKLMAENKIKFKKVGRQNQFWLNKKYQEEF